MQFRFSKYRLVLGTVFLSLVGTLAYTQTEVRIRELTEVEADGISNEGAIWFGVDKTDVPASRKISLTELKKRADVVVVATVADLATASAVDERIYQTLGYTVAGTGANMYRYDADSAATANGGTVIAGPGSVGRYIAIDQTRIDVTQFGADPTGVASSSAAFQAAVDAVFGASLVGVPIYIPVGEYLIDTSINITYSGAAAGTTSKYYGPIFIGADKFRSVISCKTTGTPAFDFTGTTRTEVRELRFSAPNDGTASACAILYARNTTNGQCSQHLVSDCTVFGYFTEAGIAGCSSEVNNFERLEISCYRNNTWCMALTEQNDLGIASDYIDTTAHTFSGGNTRNVLRECFLLYGGTTTNANGGCLLLDGTDSTTISSCYTNTGSGDAISLSASNTGFTLTNHRDESTGTGIYLHSGSTTQVTIDGGRFAQEILGADTSVVTKSKISPQNVLTSGTYSIDLYDCTDSQIHFGGAAVSIRNNMTGTSIASPYAAASLDLAGDPPPTAFTAGNSEKLRAASIHTTQDYLGTTYSLRRSDTSQTTNDLFWRVVTSGLSLQEEVHAAATGTVTIDERKTVHIFDMSGAGTLTLALSSNRFGSSVGESEGQLYVFVFNQHATMQTITLPSSFKTRGWRPERAASAKSICVMQRVTVGGATEYHLVAAYDSCVARDAITVQNGVNEASTRTLTETANRLTYNLNTGSGSYDATCTLSSTYAQRGDWWDFKLVKAASTNPGFSIRNHDASNLLTVNTGHSDATAKTIHARFLFDGTNWTLDFASESASAF